MYDQITWWQKYCTTIAILGRAGDLVKQQWSGSVVWLYSNTLSKVSLETIIIHRLLLKIYTLHAWPIHWFVSIRKTRNRIPKNMWITDQILPYMPLHSGQFLSPTPCIYSLNILSYWTSMLWLILQQTVATLLQLKKYGSLYRLWSTNKRDKVAYS